MHWAFAVLEVVVAFLFAIEVWRGITKGCINCKGYFVWWNKTPLLFTLMLVLCLGAIVSLLYIAYVVTQD